METKRNLNNAKGDLVWAGIEKEYLDYLDLFQKWEDKRDLTNFLLFLLCREKKSIPSFEELMSGDLK